MVTLLSNWYLSPFVNFKMTLEFHQHSRYAVEIFGALPFIPIRTKSELKLKEFLIFTL